MSFTREWLPAATFAYDIGEHAVVRVAGSRTMTRPDPSAQLPGINFGAPGDRKTDDGTLWLDWPSVGGPSPEISVRTEGDVAEDSRGVVDEGGGVDHPRMELLR